MATLDEVSREITSKIDGFSHDLLREIALDYTTNSKKRIFTDGIKADGKQIGEYSAVTKSIKRKKGRFTSDKVNLRDTETLVNSYIAEPKGTDYSVGFIAASNQKVTNSAKILKLKKQYGYDLFDASDEEINNVDIIINAAKFE